MMLIESLPEAHFDIPDVEDLDDVKDDWNEMMHSSLDSIHPMDFDISSFDISHMEGIDEDVPKIAEEVLQNM